MVTRKLFHLSGIMANCQSIRNKDLIVHQHLVANNLEFAILTETWLMDNLHNTVWYVASPLQNCEFKLLTSNHNSRRGGGLAIVYKDGLKVDLIQEGEPLSFHFAIWKIKSGNKCVFAISIYMPLYTPSNPITDVQFITKFAEWIPYITTQHKNTIVLGDFNFHVNDSMDVNASIFQDTMVATGVDKWVDFPTHRLGNTLDMVFTKCSSSITITSCTQGPLWSDHFTVEMSLNIPKLLLTCQKLQNLKIRSIDTNVFGKPLTLALFLTSMTLKNCCLNSLAVCSVHWMPWLHSKQKWLPSVLPNLGSTMVSPSRSGSSETESMFLRNTDQNQPAKPSK